VQGRIDPDHDVAAVKFVRRAAELGTELQVIVDAV
jgi:hypothetical protein